MKICVAQTKPVTGHIESNIEVHVQLINLAVEHGATLVVFPELSLTGYEPALASNLATHAEDKRFHPFQTLCNQQGITICVGAPLRAGSGSCIGLLIFQPCQPISVYYKQYLHADELPFFIPGHNTSVLLGSYVKIALAICYELSVPEHPKTAHEQGANIYIASVAKTPAGVAKAAQTLQATARTYGMLVLMANSIGPADGDTCGGLTAAWNKDGRLLGQLDEKCEGILVVNTISQTVITVIRETN